MGGACRVASSFVYRPQDSPRYRPGHATAISCLCVAYVVLCAQSGRLAARVAYFVWSVVRRIVLCIIAMLEFARLNREKDTIQDATDDGVGEGEGEFEEMGDKSPLFRCVTVVSLP